MRLAHVTDEHRRTARPVRLDALGDRDLAASGFVGEVPDGFHVAVCHFCDRNSPGPGIDPLQCLPEIRQPPLCKSAVVGLKAATDELARVPEHRIVGACR